LRLARDLQAIVLEKRRLFLGDDDLDTLDIMTDLAATYHALGQLKKAEEFRVAVLERRGRILGQDHPDTILTSQEQSGINILAARQSSDG
jgi:hypothetical protein